MTTQLLTMWLSVARIMLIHGRLRNDHTTTLLSVAQTQIMLIRGRPHNDHTTTLLSVAQIMLIHGRLRNDHTTTHNVVECGTDHVDTWQAAQ